LTPVLLKPLLFDDQGTRVEFPAGTPVSVVDPAVELIDDPHRLCLARLSLEEHRRRFRPAVAVLIGGRVRVVLARLVGMGEDCRGPPGQKVLPAIRRTPTR
jgi:hypothetical protein